MAVAATWTEGALWFASGEEAPPGPQVVLATARNQGASGLDVVVAGEAARVTGNARVAALLGASAGEAVFAVTPGSVIAHSDEAIVSDQAAAWAPVAVSRRIAAPAHAIFEVLADPSRHLELDGSGMLRGAATTATIAAAGDVFVMKMHFPAIGDYEMNNHVVDYVPDRYIGWQPEAGRGHPGATPEGARWGHQWGYELAPDGPDATVVTEIYDCSRAPADEREGMDGGKVWIGTMAQTLERLDRICANRAGV
jgi:hypothetical protein